MADFCAACSKEIFGEDHRDLAGITRSEDWKKGLACSVICEGCGVIQVDPDGNCVTKGCLAISDPRRPSLGHGLPFLRTVKNEPPKEDPDAT